MRFVSNIINIFPIKFKIQKVFFNYAWDVGFTSFKYTRISFIIYLIHLSNIIDY